jgi:hypothetical protein
MGIQDGIPVRAQAREAGGYGDGAPPIAGLSRCLEGLQLGIHARFSGMLWGEDFAVL